MANVGPQIQEVFESWEQEKEAANKEKLLEELIGLGVFPGIHHSLNKETYEKEGGLYPDLNNEKEFLQRLLPKQEFLDCRQESLKETKDKGIDKCRTTEDFEITPVQRFVSRLLSPRTPYKSALLFHGVGVGKTCAAITVAESYLKQYPGKKIYIVAPPNIQDGFRRTIFDLQGLRLATKMADANHRGCTGNTYLEITNTMRETKTDIIRDRVGKAIKSRYEFFGYTSFYNYIMNLVKAIPSGLSQEQITRKKLEIYRNEFSNRVIIIDEAHNLRDNPLEDDTEAADDANPADTSESKAGKRLTPYLQEVLDVAEGTTLLLMTATPMYNSFVEIVFLLNLLLRNDNFKRLSPSEVFEVSGRSYTGEFKKAVNQETRKVVEVGSLVLGKIASQYISFVRGENPLTFPIRLKPDDAPTRVKVWPIFSPKYEDLREDPDRQKCVELPFVEGFFSETTEAIYRKQSGKFVRSSDGLGITTMDLLIQAGNWIFPGDPEDDFLDRIRQQGFDNTFSKEKRGNMIYFRNTNEERGASWLREDKLAEASGKCAVLLQRLNACKGVAFVYSRFVASGALTIALALEANGYTCGNRDFGFLGEGNQHPQGRQCALCTGHEGNHGTDPLAEPHTFKPAKYVLLTGSEELSPNNSKYIDAARSPKNVNGEEVKVILGSQIAGEGLDLRYIREIFVFDGWYHLNKLEQVIGRGIRNCSHSALPETKRNCTVTLLVNAAYRKKQEPDEQPKSREELDPNQESIDMYSYRLALKKAIIMGKVTRVLKEFAIDCTLNQGVNQVKDLEDIPIMLDSQGKQIGPVPIRDVPLSSMCDWLEDCDFKCKFGDGQKIDITQIQSMTDTSTYDQYSARFQMKRIKTELQKIIAEGSPFIKYEIIKDYNKDFKAIPEPLLKTLLQEIVDEKEIFTVPPKDPKDPKDKGLRGYIVLKNEYFVFQPERIKNTSIPIALRMAHLPIPKDRFPPPPPAEKKPTAESLEQVSSEEDSEGVWDQALAWTRAMRIGNADTKEVPEELVEEVSKLQSSAGSLLNSQKERLQMILLLYKTIPERVRNDFADVVLEYIWDEYLTFATKKHLLSTKWTDPDIEKVSANETDARWELEGNLYLRLLKDVTENPKGKSRGEHPATYYISIEGGVAVPSSKAVIDELEKNSATDPLLRSPNQKINTKYTGFEYGFLVYNLKKRRFIFKTNEPPAPGKKISRGKECSNDSASVSYQISLFKRFAENLQKKGYPDFGLDKLEIKNSVRVCTVGDIILRYMNKVKLDGKRWFYRALEAKLHNHPL